MVYFVSYDFLKCVMYVINNVFTPQALHRNKSMDFPHSPIKFKSVVKYSVPIYHYIFSYDMNERSCFVFTG